MAANLNVVIHDLCAYVKMWSTLRSLENTQEVRVARGNSYTSFVQQGIFFALSRLGRELFYQFHRQGSLKMADDRAGSVHDARWWGGGYFHTLPIRVCAAQRGRDFEAPDLERGIHFRGVF